MSRSIQGPGLGVAIAAGIVWAQLCIALELLVLPGYIALGDRLNEGVWFRLAEWTLLAPLTLATGLVSLVASSETSPASADPTLGVLTLSSCVGVALCVALWWVLAVPEWRRAGMVSLVGFVLLGTASFGAVALQLHQAADAERTFFAMVSRVEAAHKDPATVSAAREFAHRHPDSRWAGEALRIVAMAEWDAGHIGTASQLWRQFALRFRDPAAPGVAYAEYSIALCYERLGRRDDARRHHRAAIDVIRTRGDGVQAWIATDAAARLSAAERRQGRYALAGYWNTKSRTFANVYSTE